MFEVFVPHSLARCWSKLRFRIEASPLEALCIGAFTHFSGQLYQFVFGSVVMSGQLFETFTSFVLIACLGSLPVQSI